MMYKRMSAGPGQRAVGGGVRLGPAPARDTQRSGPGFRKAVVTRVSRSPSVRGMR